MLERLEVLAKASGVNLSAVMRIALQRGVAAMEREAEPAPAQSSPPLRRRVISKGVF